MGSSNRYPYAVSGGYNGGGGGGSGYSSWGGGAGGGGATHIATVGGLLKDLAAYKDTDSANVSKEILIVAGGGGGGANSGFTTVGGYGGGIDGGTVYAGSPSQATIIAGGTQTNGYNFGRGQTGRNATQAADLDANGTGGAGGGWYGGFASQSTVQYSMSVGAGGSGYIASSNLISGSGITKHMTCYSCTTSSDANTRTYSNTNVSATTISDYSKSGNGYARITYLGTSI